VNSTLPEASPLAAFMLLGLFLSAGWLLAPQSRPAWIRPRAEWAIGAVSGAVIAATLSAAAWVSCAIWLPLMVAIAGSGRRRRVAVGIGALCAVAILALITLSRTSGGGPSGFLDNQRYVRAGYWIAGLKMVAAHPLGVGVGNYAFYYPLHAPLSSDYEYQVGIADAHNLFLDAAAETGIAGVVLLVAFVGTLVFTGIRGAARGVRAGQAEALGLALAAALGAELTMHLTFSYAYYPFEWVVAGLVGSIPAILVGPGAHARARSAETREDVSSAGAP
jgi:O-antigen ligase